MTGMLDKSREPENYPREALLADSQLLEESEIFDASAYAAATGIASSADAARHYLVDGWRRGFEPGPHFEGRFLYPYYRSVGYSGPPALTYLTLSASGSASYRGSVEAEAAASVIRKSPYFDAAFYRARFPRIGNLDPALHYVLVGEGLGYSPSELFDPKYYVERYPGVVTNASNALIHFLTFDQGKGRSTVSRASKMTFDFSRLEPSRPSVLLLSHEATRTGAPILAYNIALKLREKYNVVALLLRGGNLVGDFQNCCAAVIGPLTDDDWHPVEAKRIVQRLMTACRFSYAIANSIETRNFSPWVARSFVPVIGLVHEFASYTRPKETMVEAFDWATELVFSTELTASSAKAEHLTLSGRRVHILPQGQCELPAVETPAIASRDSATLRRLIRPTGDEDAFVVLGAGSVHIRKGVDLFIACAAAVKASMPARKIRFVWIGGGYDPQNDMTYSCYLAEQLSRSGVGDNCVILNEVEDLELVYSETDIFFLSSRLDPLPNVAIDAACRGIPVICFEGATGIAEIVGAEPATRPCVLPYLDVNAAARIVVDLANDESRRAEICQTLLRLAGATFDMGRYIAQLDRLGAIGVDLMRARVLDHATLRDDPTFDSAFFLRADSAVDSRDEAIVHYLTYWSAVQLSPHGSRDPSFRRPCAGFHPQIYAHENAGRLEPLVDPSADYIRKGKPNGPWRHNVVTPTELSAPVEGLRTCLHAHLFYPELAQDLLGKLMVNGARCDLLLSTGSEPNAEVLRRATATYDGGEVLIRIVPNRGRDIGPLLTAFGDDISRYDIVGHMHGKRSLEVGGSMGDTWREFLWQNLVGDFFPMMDTILARFAGDPELGLVFPDDPHMVGWDSNLGIATDLARKMGITETLPPFFDFPVGTMFWARTQALLPLWQLKLDWDDYPPEPLPYDGTIIHALERLLPFVAKKANYDFATTHIPGVTR